MTVKVWYERCALPISSLKVFTGGILLLLLPLLAVTGSGVLVLVPTETEIFCRIPQL